MSDLLDQLDERASKIKREDPPPIAVDFIVVVRVNSRWRVLKYKGKATECEDRVRAEFGIEIANPATQWARGYMADNGAFVVHPRNNRIAEKMIVDRLTRAQAQR